MNAETCGLCQGEGAKAGNCPLCGKRKLEPGKRALDEAKDKETIEAWFKKADSITLEELPAFMRMLSDEYQHDYGTICHAITAVGVAAMKAFDRGPCGGITGFQAGCIMWGVIERWGALGDGPKKILCYRDLLYPQMAEKFEKEISAATWAWTQAEAKKALATFTGVENPAVRAHLESVAGGVLPFGFVVKAG